MTGPLAFKSESGWTVLSLFEWVVVLLSRRVGHPSVVSPVPVHAPESPAFAVRAAFVAKWFMSSRAWIRREGRGRAARWIHAVRSASLLDDDRTSHDRYAHAALSNRIRVRQVCEELDVRVCVVLRGDRADPLVGRVPILRALSNRRLHDGIDLRQRPSDQDRTGDDPSPTRQRHTPVVAEERRVLHAREVTGEAELAAPRHAVLEPDSCAVGRPDSISSSSRSSSR